MNVFSILVSGTPRFLPRSADLQSALRFGPAARSSRSTVQRFNHSTMQPIPGFILALSLLCCLTLPTRASIPAPEKLLPDDTLLVVTAPDFSKVRDAFKASTQNQAWSDPALKPFK